MQVIVKIVKSSGRDSIGAPLLDVSVAELDAGRGINVAGKEGRREIWD
jgi:hypothetical protein